MRSEPDARRYFRSLIDDVARDLALEVDLGAFWTRSADKANGQIVVDFFRLVLQALPGPVVVVLDEIDSTLESAQLGFTDDLFTAIRGIYTSRPREPSFKRLTFCLFVLANTSETGSSTGSSADAGPSAGGPSDTGVSITTRPFSPHDRRRRCATPRPTP